MRYVKTAGTMMMWALQAFASFAFVFIGIAKFWQPFWIAGFARWGYSGSFRMLIGVLELAGGVMLAFPPTASYAAALIGCIMLGAVGTLALHNEHPTPPLFWFFVMALIGLVRWHRAWRPKSHAAQAALDPV
jgi:hypothetical protein